MIRRRDRVGLNLPPLFLRLMLAVVFIWAGLGKISASMPVQGDDAALLANMGVISPAGGAPAPERPASPEPAPPARPSAEPPQAPEAPRPGASLGGPVITLARQAGPGPYSASQFTEPVQVLRVYGLALAIYKAAHPAAPAAGGGAAPMPLWPQQIGEGRWPVYLAWAVALTELIGGAGLLIGLFTRLMALAIAGVMLGAIWLTQIGPAIQKGQATLGFLPGHAAFDTQAWQPLMFQFALFMAALALAFLGPGRLSLDQALLGGSHGEDDDE